MTARTCASRRYRGRVCSEDDQCHNHAGYFCAGDAEWAGGLADGGGEGLVAIRYGRPAVTGPHRSLPPTPRRTSRFRGPRFHSSILPPLAHPHSFLVCAPTVIVSVARYRSTRQHRHSIDNDDIISPCRPFISVQPVAPCSTTYRPALERRSPPTTPVPTRLRARTLHRTV